MGKDGGDGGRDAGAAVGVASGGILDMSGGAAANGARVVKRC